MADEVDGRCRGVQERDSEEVARRGVELQVLATELRRAERLEAESAARGAPPSPPRLDLRHLLEQCFGGQCLNKGST